MLLLVLIAVSFDIVVKINNTVAKSNICDSPLRRQLRKEQETSFPQRASKATEAAEQRCGARRVLRQPTKSLPGTGTIQVCGDVRYLRRYRPRPARYTRIHPPFVTNSTQQNSQ